MFSFETLFNSYKKWISQNPEKASDFETTIKWLSYFISGRINNSILTSELVYSLSNLLVFFNDRIIAKERQWEIPSSGDKIKTWLMVISYTEVVFEISAYKYFGKAGKWFIIVVIQLFKVLCKLILIHYYKESVIQNPVIPVLERRLLSLPPSQNNISNDEMKRLEMNSISFTLKNSGKRIRKVNTSPDLQLRTWKPLDTKTSQQNDLIDYTPADSQLVAETIYVAKPVLHLGTMFCFGTKSWKPWFLSLLLDFLSLKIYNSEFRKNKVGVLSHQQKLLLSKRYAALLIYFLRSPFYDRYSKNPTNALLISMSKNIPLAGFICGPLEKYLPFWQSNYFYMWST